MARPKTDLKSNIIEEATALFMQQGYAATSIKQIAKAAGCTTAALYYYFEDGKAHLLREVVQSHSLNIMKQLEDDHSETLEDFLAYFTGAIAQDMPKMLGRIQWLIPEFPRLAPEEQLYIRQQLHTMQQTLRQHLARFIADNDAEMMAWLIISTYMGFGQLFMKIGIQEDVDIGVQTFSAFFVKMLSVGHS